MFLVEESSGDLRCDLDDCIFTTKVLAQPLLAETHDDFRDLDSKPPRLDSKQICVAGAPLCTDTCKEFPATEKKNFKNLGDEFASLPNP